MYVSQYELCKRSLSCHIHQSVDLMYIAMPWFLGCLSYTLIYVINITEIAYVL
jgi:hypothetical protein